MHWRSSSPIDYDLLRSNARENRKHMTEAESVLWDALRGNNLGHKFLRQHIIGEYIADFLCRDKKLVIEVDGGYHNTPEQQQLDQDRTAFLESEGYQVIRFTNEQVLLDLDNTISFIKSKLEV